jgi:SAM-dependent methyltransferase
MTADRSWLRTTFDDTPEVYDRTRPVCPPQLFDDLLDLAGLGTGARLLEIGCGTGQATLPLAERGCAMVGVELGRHLAEFARRKLASYPNVEIIAADFETWDAAGATFDGVVGFNAFHWLDPNLRYGKSAQLLRDGGALAAVTSKFVLPDHADPFWTEVQEDYDAIRDAPAPDRPPHPDVVADLREEIDSSGYFHTEAVRRYLWTMRYSAEEYVALLSTSSWHRQLDAGERRAFFKRLHRRVATQADGAVSATLLAILHVTRRL